MRKILVFITFFALCVPVFCQIVSQDKSDMVLYVDQTKAIPVSGIRRIAIGKPEVVDALMVSEYELVLGAKKPGYTTVAWWDSTGEHSISIKVYAFNMTEVKDNIDNLIKETGIAGVYTKAMDSEEKIFLMGEVEKADNEKLTKILKDYLEDNMVVNLVNTKDEKTLVEIDVKVLELTTGAARTLGFDLPTGIDFDEVSGPTVEGEDPSTGFFKVFHVSDWKRSSFDFKIDFLVQQGKAKILSRPRLLCQSGKKANLLVGGEVPVMTTVVSDGGGTGTSVEYKEYGIQLDIQPTVIEQDTIELDLDMDISEVVTSEVATLGGDTPTARAFPLTKRSVASSLLLKNEATVSIGGLIKAKDSETLKKFPWLADIPILGTFFRHSEKKKGGGASAQEDIELFITLTPRIIPLKNEKKKIVEPPKQGLSEKDEVFSYYEEMRIPKELKGYTYDVQQKILSNVTYPQMLFNTGWEATVVLSLKIASNGDLKEAKVIQPSGYKIFDETALGVVRKLTYPPFPPQVRLKEISIDVPIAYRTQK